MKRLLLTCGVALVSAGAWARDRCVVTDPTGTPLNLRSRPNGPIIGTFRDGAAVRVRDRTRDRLGRPWVYVAPEEDGKSGWVFREHISCAYG